MTTIGKRLLKARKLRGFSQQQLATGTSNTRPLISMVESGRANLSVANLTAAAKALGVSVDFLCGLTTDPTPARQLATELADSTTRARDLEEQLACLPTADDGDYVGVSELAGAAGGGAVVDDERITGRVKFRRGWLTRHGLAATQCRVIHVLGESMEPTPLDSCSILVNQASQRRRVGRIYVVRTEDGLVVKRAGKDRAGAWQHLSDNPNNQAWPTAPLPPQRAADRPGQLGDADVPLRSEPLELALSAIARPLGAPPPHPTSPALRRAFNLPTNGRPQLPPNLLNYRLADQLAGRSVRRPGTATTDPPYCIAAHVEGQPPPQTAALHAGHQHGPSAEPRPSALPSPHLRPPRGSHPWAASEFLRRRSPGSPIAPLPTAGGRWPSPSLPPATPPRQRAPVPPVSTTPLPPPLPFPRRASGNSACRTRRPPRINAHGTRRTPPRTLMSAPKTPPDTVLQPAPAELSPEEIRFYRSNEKPYGAFSNLFPRPVTLHGRVYPTAEHAYQAGKPRKEAVRQWLLSAPTPALLAMAAHGLYTWDIVSNWSSIKTDRMRAVLRAKFTQHSDLRTLLLSTQDARLVEAPRTDTAINRYWGEVNGKGSNMLGRLLMDLRTELRSQPEPTPTSTHDLLPSHNARPSSAKSSQ